MVWQGQKHYLIQIIDVVNEAIYSGVTTIRLIKTLKSLRAFGGQTNSCIPILSHIAGLREPSKWHVSAGPMAF